MCFIINYSPWILYRVITTMTNLKGTTWQQKMSEKEHKLRSIYNQQQQRAHQVAQRGSAGSNASSGSESNAMSSHPGTTESLKSNLHTGKVRQMFDERRQTTVKGIDRSYPLEPLVKTKKKVVNVPAKKQNSKITYQTSGRIMKTEVNDNQIKESSSAISHPNEDNTFGPKLIHYEEDLDELYNGNYVPPVSKWQSQIAEAANSTDGETSKKDRPIKTKTQKPTKLGSDDTPGQLMSKIKPAAFSKIKISDFSPQQKTVRPDTTSRKLLSRKKSTDKTIKRLPDDTILQNVKHEEEKNDRKDSDRFSAKYNNNSHRRSSIKELRGADNNTSLLGNQSPNSTSPASVISPIENNQSSPTDEIRDNNFINTIQPTLSNKSMVSCKICGRKFAFDRIELHTTICLKTSQKKRKVFDASTHRVQGTEMEPFVMQKPSKRGQSEKMTIKREVKSNWRRKHEDFINVIRSAKGVQAHLAAGGKLSDLPPPPPSDTSDYITCPHCGRKFNQSAAERHIPKCQNMLHNKPKPRAPARPKR